jgi:hypothetical protein
VPEAARDRNREPPQGGLPDSVFEKNYRLQDIQLSKNRPGFGLKAFWLWAYSRWRSNSQSAFALRASARHPSLAAGKTA